MIGRANGVGPKLAARIANRDFGMPLNPRTELVESEWITGDSLKQPKE